MQLNADTFYELCQYLTLAELRNLCKSNKEIHKISQTERFQQLFQQKLIAKVLKKSAYGFKYVIVPNEHILTYSNCQADYTYIVLGYEFPDSFRETISQDEKGKPRHQSVLVKLYGKDVYASLDKDVCEYELDNSTYEQLLQIIQVLIDRSDFAINRLGRHD